MSSYLGALDPERVSAHALARASKIGQAGTSRNTARVREAALAYWRGWYAARYRQALAIPPIGLPVPIITQFLVDHALVDPRVLRAGRPAGEGRCEKGAGAAQAPHHQLRLSIMSAEHRGCRPKAASTRRSTTRPWIRP